MVIMVHIVRFVPVHLARLRYQFPALECPFRYPSRPASLRIPLALYGIVSSAIETDSALPARIVFAEFPTVRAEPLFRIPQPLDVALADMAHKGALATLDRHNWAWHDAVPLWLVNVLPCIPCLSFNLCQFITQSGQLHNDNQVA